MTDFYIFRHGETSETSSIVRRFMGHVGKDSNKIDIEPKGFPALKRIGNFMKNIKTDADFTSPYKRCVNSAEIVGNISNKKYLPDERIRELEKNGEGFKAFEKRVRNFLEEIKTKNYSSVSICTHGATIGCLKHLIISDSFYFFNIWDFPQPGNLVIIKNGKIEVKNFN